MSDARSQIKLFSMGAAVLMMLATEILVAYHYYNLLSGFALIALVGLVVVAWVIAWSTWWASKAGEDNRVKYTAYIVAFVVSLVMIFNGAMVVADLTLNKRIAKEESNDIARIEAQGRAAAELKKAGGTWREMRELRESQKQNAGSATLRIDAPTKADVEQFQWVSNYNSLWIFFVPFAVALAGKFLLLAVIALPGGASGFLPPSAAPRPAPSPGFAPPTGGGGLPIPNPFHARFDPDSPSEKWRDRVGPGTGTGDPKNRPPMLPR